MSERVVIGNLQGAEQVLEAQQGDTAEVNRLGLLSILRDARRELERVLAEREKLREDQREAVAIDTEAGRLPPPWASKP